MGQGTGGSYICVDGGGDGGGVLTAILRLDGFGLPSDSKVSKDVTHQYHNFYPYLQRWDRRFRSCAYVERAHDQHGPGAEAVCGGGLATVFLGLSDAETHGQSRSIRLHSRSSNGDICTCTA
jgi:hypothetical protein